MASRAKYMTEYIKANIRSFTFKVNRNNYSKVIQYLEDQLNINEYLLRLVKADMEKQQTST